MKTEISQPDGIGHIKGAAFREFLIFYGKNVDPVRAAAAVKASGSFELNTARSDFGILQNTWYPAELVHELLDRLTEGFDEPELEKLAQAAAIHIMGVTLHGVYKTMFSLIATPERYARHIPKLWKVHYDNGEPAVVIRAPNVHHITFSAGAATIPSRVGSTWLPRCPSTPRWVARKCAGGELIANPSGESTAPPSSPGSVETGRRVPGIVTVRTQ